MEELFELVLRLLGHHSCVIVPGLGGFLSDGRPASITSDGVAFVPPTREILFNRLLTHNDGLLAQEYMRIYHKTFEEANVRIDETVSSIKSELKLRKSILVGDWGMLAIAGKAVTFEQRRPVLMEDDAFGLKEFYYPQLHILPKSGEIKNTVSKSSLRPLWWAAAVVVALFCIQPLQRENAQYASFQPVGLLVSNLQSEVVEQQRRNDTLKCELQSMQSASEGFYWILSDFATEAEANHFAAEVSSQTADSLRIFSLKNKYYVSAAEADSKEEILRRSATSTLDAAFRADAYILSVSKIQQ